MKLYHLDRAADYRRVILDVLEICPRRYRTKIMEDMSLVRDEGEDMGFYFNLHGDLLQFLYRLRTSRTFRGASPHQSAVLDSVIDRLSEAYLYDTGEAFVFMTAEADWAQRKQSQESIKRQVAWVTKHPLLSQLSFLFNGSTAGPLIMLIAVSGLELFLGIKFHWFIKSP